MKYQNLKVEMKFMRITLLLLLSTIYAASAWGAGSCSAYPTSCSPPCDSSCTYYSFSSATSTDVMRKVPYLFTPLKPAVPYCDLDGESKINAVMKKVPYRIGSNAITKIPWRVVLNYKKVISHTANGPPCCVNNVDAFGQTFCGNVSALPGNIRVFRTQIVGPDGNAAGYTYQTMTGGINGVGGTVTPGLPPGHTSPPSDFRLDGHIPTPPLPPLPPGGTP